MTRKIIATGKDADGSLLEIKLDISIKSKGYTNGEISRKTDRVREQVHNLLLEHFSYSGIKVR